MSHFMGVGIFRIGLNRTDLGSWRLTLNLKALGGGGCLPPHMRFSLIISKIEKFSFHQKIL